MKNKSSLVLGRRVGEKVLVGTPPNHVIIQVLGVSADRADIHFLAPNDIPIDRWEVAERKGRLPESGV